MPCQKAMKRCEIGIPKVCVEGVEGKRGGAAFVGVGMSDEADEAAHDRIPDLPTSLPTRPQHQLSEPQSRDVRVDSSLGEGPILGECEVRALFFGLRQGAVISRWAGTARPYREATEPQPKAEEMPERAEPRMGPNGWVRAS